MRAWATEKAHIHIRHPKLSLNYLSPHCPSIFAVEIMRLLRTQLTHSTLDLASVGQFCIQLLSTPFFTHIGSARSRTLSFRANLQFRKFANPCPFRACRQRYWPARSLLEKRFPHSYERCGANAAVKLVKRRWRETFVMQIVALFPLSAALSA